MRLSSRAFTLAELVVLICIAVVVVLLMPPMCRYRGEDAGRTIAGTRLNGIYKTLFTYSVSNAGSFPIYKTDNPAGPAMGFREGDRRTGAGAVLENNITAPLWMIVRDGSAHPKNFVNPKVMDEEDPLTVSTTDKTPAPLNLTFDFLERKNLSYSVMNMYDPTVGTNWGPNTNADWVYLADNNANDYTGKPGRHTLSKGATQADVSLAENSPCDPHFEGQRVMYGDGHVGFENHPFVGPGGDNIYAVATAKGNEPPTVTSKAGSKDDVALIPLSGNGGGSGSLSGLALDVKPRPTENPFPAPWLMLVVVGTLGVIFVLGVQRMRMRKPGKAEECEG